MIGRDSREDMERYGAAPWIYGVILGAGLCYVMFELALPIGG